MDAVYDIAIIGGGINGTGCAADATLRGLSVFLCEGGDIASKTSSKSTKLIHGGLRYLEYYDFALVKKALEERQILLELAPHLVQPQAFFLPHKHTHKPAWVLRMGLFLYDKLSFKNTLPNSRTYSREENTAKPYFEALDVSCSKGFVFYDAVTDDARLTLANALQAKKNDATIATRTTLINATIQNGIWKLTLKSGENALYTVFAKCVINATGPWVNLTNELLQAPTFEKISWIKGSHIVFPKLYEGNHSYLLLQEDKRVVFAIPYHGYTMVGTTEVTYHGDLSTVEIDENEINYLCNAANTYFKNPVKPKDIIDTWSGIRPLLANDNQSPKELSRDYKLHFSNTPAPLVTIYGGKITTYRKLAEQAINLLSPVFKTLPPSITKSTFLPGAKTGEGLPYSHYRFIAQEKFHWLNQELLERYLTTYGTETENLLKNAHNIEDLGQDFGNMLYQIEVDYMCQEEWAQSSEDILNRRTKLNLQANTINISALEAYLAKQVSPLSLPQRAKA